MAFNYVCVPPLKLYSKILGEAVQWLQYNTSGKLDRPVTVSRTAKPNFFGERELKIRDRDEVYSKQESVLVNGVLEMTGLNTDINLWQWSLGMLTRKQANQALEAVDVYQQQFALHHPSETDALTFFFGVDPGQLSPLAWLICLLWYDRFGRSVYTTHLSRRLQERRKAFLRGLRQTAPSSDQPPPKFPMDMAVCVASEEERKEIARRLGPGIVETGTGETNRVKISLGNLTAAQAMKTGQDLRKITRKSATQ